ncbi:MAG: aminotransferase class I/II-fold pyridoxal phosphate-dependent enzyme [Proteobacteria bacterium]|nr:aminotransferase class I/II-fold pyridoxal phosphate-dependent enzyme [Pseudomonadota bacterium]
MYKVTQSDGFLNLSLNENYLSFCKEETLALTNLNRYPNTEIYKQIEEEAGKLYGVNAQNILLTNGSDDGIFLIQQWFTRNGGGSIIITNPTFSMYENYANNLGLGVIKQNLDENLEINVPQLIEAITHNPNSAVFIPNPNSPTGSMLSLATIEEILQTNTTIIIDEAYIEFSGEASATDLLGKYSNLIILRTLSKFYGLAAVRIGFVMGGDAQNIKKFQAPFSVSSPNAEIALKTLRHINNMAEISSFTKEFIQNRADFVQELQQKKNVVKIYETSANFVLFEVNNIEEVLKRFNGKKFLVKDFSGILPNTIRVSLATKEINEEILFCV